MWLIDQTLLVHWIEPATLLVKDKFLFLSPKDDRAPSTQHRKAPAMKKPSKNASKGLPTGSLQTVASMSIQQASQQRTDTSCAAGTPAVSEAALTNVDYQDR